MNPFTRYQGTDLFLPTAAGSAVRSGYLVPAGAAVPDSIGIADALNTYGGWFVLFPDLLQDPAAFIRQAQLYLANPARTGALIAWFLNPDEAAQGLAAWVLTAPRASGQPVTVTRPGLLQFSNLTLNLGRGATVAVAADGDGLTFVGGSSALSVTPFDDPTPVSLPLTGAVTLGLTRASAINGCLIFGLTLDAAAGAALDVGLRMFTAPPGGGYAATVRYPVIEFAGASGGIPLSATLDPLAPLDEARSVFAFADTGFALPSSYRTPVGGALTLTPQAGAGLVFAARLSAVDAAGQPVVPSGGDVLYMVPTGSFGLAPASAAPRAMPAVGAAPDLTANLMCGLSGVEYLSIAPGTALSFVTGGSAFAPTVQAADDGSAPTFGPLTGTALTSWCHVSVPGGSTYFAQPDSAVMHQPGGAATAAPLLHYAPLPVAQLAPAATGAPFPLLPYAAAQIGPGLSPGDVAQFEAQVVGPQRRRLMPPPTPTPTPATSAADTPATTTTPQGLLLTQAGSDWQSLVLGVSPSAPPADAGQGKRSQQLVLSHIGGDLQDALLSNQLFLVVTSTGAMMANAQIPYSLTPARLDILANVVKLDPAVIAALQPLKGQCWADQDGFDAALQAQLTPAQYKDNQPAILAYAGDFSLFVADWEFDLSPWRWADHNSILILKFCTKPLDRLVCDTSQWVRADIFNVSASAAQQQVRAILDDATARLANGDTDLAHFVNTVMLDPMWNGILVLNAEAPMAGLPAQLEGLAAGIDAAQFQAHHVGIDVTPVQASGGTLTPAASSVFGLIDYEDPADLSGTALDYQFKVKQLKVLIANSEITGFSSVIELMVNKLFGEPAQQIGAPSNCLQLTGYYQQSGGVGSYTFTTPAATAFAMTSRVLNRIGVLQASFVTLSSNDPGATTVATRFMLNGSIDFAAQGGFDLFSYGAENGVPPTDVAVPGLTYANLSIDMSFDVATPTYKTFAFDAQHILLDASTSQVRAASLAAHFPMKLAGLYQAGGSVTPDTLGYMPVDSPLQGSALSAPWFGLRYDLDLGSLGALAAQAGFTAGLLLAWSPSPGTATVYVGLSLPGVSGGQRAISLQGVLGLSFGTVTFLVQPPTYILELSSIVLKVLSLSFPPGGQTSLLLFGNPNAQTSGALGWYASYVKNGAGSGKKATPAIAAPPPALPRLEGPRP